MMTKMNDLQYRKLDKALLEAFPELKEAYIKKIGRGWSDPKFRPGQYIVFGFVFNPYLIEIIESADKKKLSRIFTFIEKLASSEDKKVVDLVKVEILERLTDKQEWWTTAKKYMGPKTLELSKETEKWFKVR